MNTDNDFDGNELKARIRVPNFLTESSCWMNPAEVETFFTRIDNTANSILQSAIKGMITDCEDLENGPSQRDIMEASREGYMIAREAFHSNIVQNIRTQMYADPERQIAVKLPIFNGILDFLDSMVIDVAANEFIQQKYGTENLNSILYNTSEEHTNFINQRRETYDSIPELNVLGKRLYLYQELEYMTGTYIVDKGTAVYKIALITALIAETEPIFKEIMVREAELETLQLEEMLLLPASGETTVAEETIPEVLAAAEQAALNTKTGFTSTPEPSIINKLRNLVRLFNKKV